jgi:uncharacterized protein YgiM (DUF1202 family)
MRFSWLTVCLLFICLPAVASDEDIQNVLVADPFIEIHTGPGSGYPITHVVERGVEIGILKRRTDWFSVRDPDGKEGWVYIDQLEQTLQLSGEPVEVPLVGLEQYRVHQWEAGLLGGDFGGASSIAVYGSYGLSKHLAFELNAMHLLGNYSNGWGVDVSLVHTFMPEWRVSPFFSLGTGIVHDEQNLILAQSDDQTDQVAIVGIGAKAYLSRRFMLRAEYRNYVVLRSTNENEDVGEWKVGFAVFF